MLSFARGIVVVSRGAALTALAAIPAPAFAAGPDLVVAEIDTSALGGDFQALTLSGVVSATIRNQGDEDTPSDVVVVFFEDRNLTEALEIDEDNILFTIVDPPIAAGEDRVVAGDVTGASVLFRGNRVFVLADADDSILESDETNNLRSTADDCVAAPDLTASLLAFACVGDDALVSARVGNGGSLPAAALLPVSFYDGDPAAGGVLIGTAATSAPLLPGRFETVSLRVGSPVAGAISAVADDAGGLAGVESECDETNNVHSADIADRTPPVIACPIGRIVVDVSDVNDVPVVYAASAVDDCDPDPAVRCQPPSGSIFPVGETTVACVATDSIGNTAFCTFDVRVRPSVDFDRTASGAVADGTLVAEQYVPLGVRVSAISNTGRRGAFARRPGPPGASTDDLVPVSAPNYLQTSSGADDSDSGEIAFEFVDPVSRDPRSVSSVSLAFLDVEDSGFGPGGRGASRLLAFDAGGVLVDAVDVPVGSNRGMFVATVAAREIARAVAIVGDFNDSAGVDALRFEPVPAALDVRILGDSPEAPLGETYGFHVVSRNRTDSPITIDVIVRATLAFSREGRLVLGPRPLRAPSGVRVFGGTSDYEIALPRSKPRLWHRTVHLVAEGFDPATGTATSRATTSFVIRPPR